MSKFNTAPAPDPFGRAGRGTSPIRATSTTPTTVTHEGAPAFNRDARSELFLTASAGFIAENKYYEKGNATVARVIQLACTVATEAGPAPTVSAFTGKIVDAAVGSSGVLIGQHVDTGLAWLLPFVGWLRREGNMRTAPMVIAIEAGRARAAAGIHGGGRELLRTALYRADEPGEAIAYWDAQNYGRPLPKWFKRGVMDSLDALYTEYSALKYDTSAHKVRFGDVIELCADQGASWKRDGTPFARWLIDRRHGRGEATGEMAAARQMLEGIPRDARRGLLGNSMLPPRMREAGVTWEWLSGWLSDGQGMDAKAWETVIPSMGYMALLRNLRNFDEAGINSTAAEFVAAKLSDPAQVARSMQFPFRFYSAYKNAPNLRWSVPLDTALSLSVANVPLFQGRTTVYIDTSASMGNGLSAKSQMDYATAAALFGVALAHANPGRVDLYGFASGVFAHTVRLGGSLIEEVKRFTARIGEVGHGTDGAQAIVRTARDGATGQFAYDRVIIISDMQMTSYYYTNTVDTVVPAHVPLYAFNLCGYDRAAIPSGTRNRHELGGLTDATFRMIPTIEAGQAARWPWEQ